MIKRTIISIVLVLVITSGVFADIPHLINYQGKLTDSGGVPLNGSYDVTFRIYDKDGNMLWYEEHTQAKGAPVTVTKGIFSVMLGSLKDLTLAFDKPYWLAIQVGGDPEMTPRQQITSVGYAISSKTSELANNSNAVNNIQASTVPQPNKLLPLDNNAKLPIGALKVYDSGWFAVTRDTNYTLIHNLGTTKIIPYVWFSTNPDGSANVHGVLAHGFDDLDQTGAELQFLTSTTVVIRAKWDHVARPETGQDSGTDYTSGYYRVVFLALE